METTECSDLLTLLLALWLVSSAFLRVIEPTIGLSGIGGGVVGALSELLVFNIGEQSNRV